MSGIAACDSFWLFLIIVSVASSVAASGYGEAEMFGADGWFFVIWALYFSFFDEFLLVLSAGFASVIRWFVGEGLHDLLALFYYFLFFGEAVLMTVFWVAWHRKLLGIAQGEQDVAKLLGEVGYHVVGSVEFEGVFVD